MENIARQLSESIAVKQQLLEYEEGLRIIAQIADTMIEAFRNGGKVLLCGNGGSASDAQHIAAELSGRYGFDRPPLFAEALHVNASFLTAVANDYGYEEVFSRLVRAKGARGDILVGLSTSGNSANVVKALTVANEMGMITVSLTGEGGGQMKNVSRFTVSVPSAESPRIQECHITIGHILCEIVERALFKDNGTV